MIKYEIRVLLKGSIVYKKERINHRKVVDEYDMELIKMVEEKLIKVKKITVKDQIKNINKKPEKDSKEA
jgi:hypothetical protein